MTAWHTGETNMTGWKSDSPKFIPGMK